MDIFDVKALILLSVFSVPSDGGVQAETFNLGYITDYSPQSDFSSAISIALESMQADPSSMLSHHNFR